MKGIWTDWRLLTYWRCASWLLCVFQLLPWRSFKFLCGPIYHTFLLWFSDLCNVLRKAILPSKGHLKHLWGLPWWRSGWESACQCRGHRFEPWSGKIPHAEEQLGPWATITEPARLEPVLRNKRGRESERPAHHDEEWPPLAATRESPRTETKTQHSQK